MGNGNENESENENIPKEYMRNGQKLKIKRVGLSKGLSR